jgi:hypothetical protein
LEQKAGKPLVLYRNFQYLSDAVQYITEGTDEDEDDDDDKDDDVLLIELKRDVGRKKFEAVHAKMPTDSDEDRDDDDDNNEEEDHLTTTAKRKMATTRWTSMNVLLTTTIGT